MIALFLCFTTYEIVRRVDEKLMGPFLLLVMKNWRWSSRNFTQKGCPALTCCRMCLHKSNVNLLQVIFSRRWLRIWGWSTKMANCAYSKQVWQQVEVWSGEQGLKQNQHSSRIKNWWTLEHSAWDIKQASFLWNLNVHKSWYTQLGIYGRSNAGECEFSTTKLLMRSVYWIQ